MSYDGGVKLVSVLENDYYPVGEAARLLEVPPSTLRWWLEGRSYQGKTYLPVLREQPTGSGLVTWGEFVEAGYLSAYRRRDVPLGELRDFIEGLRKKLGVRYPLAHYQPFISENHSLVLDVQWTAGLPAEFGLLYEVVNTGQLLLSPAATTFLEKVEFSPTADRAAVRVYPNGRKSPVVIDAEMAFGAPSIKGIRTEAIAELIDAGEDPDRVADNFGLSVREVKAAAAFEWQLAAFAA